MEYHDLRAVIFISLKSEIRRLKRQIRNLDDEFFDLQNTFCRERKRFRDKLKEKDDQFTAHVNQLQRMSEELQTANTDLESKTKMVISLKSKVKVLKNTLDWERKEFRFKLQNQRAQLRDNYDQLNIEHENQLQCTTEKLQKAYGYINEMAMERDYWIFYLTCQLQQKFRDEQEQDIRFQQALNKMKQKDVECLKYIGALENEKNCSEKEVGLLKEKLTCEDDKTERLKESLKFKEKEIRELNDKIRELNGDMLKRTKKQDDQLSKNSNGRLQQSSKEIAFENTDAETNRIVTLNTTIQHLEREMKIREIKVKRHEEELKSINNELHERIILLESKLKDKDDKLSKLREQQKKTLKDSIEKEEGESNTSLKRENQELMENLKKQNAELEERNDALKKKILHLEAEVERCNDKNKGLEETLNRKKKEISDTNERYDKAVEEKDAISSHVSDLRQLTKRTQESEATKLNKIITTLKFENQSFEKEMKLRDAKLKNLEKMQDDKNIKQRERINKLENTIKEKDDQLSAHMYQHQQSMKMWHEKESELRETVTSQKRNIYYLEKDAQQQVLNIKDLEDQLKKTDVAKTACPREDVTAMKNMIADLKQQLKQTQTKVRDTEAELNETKTRLSKAMGERLTDNNLNITDLSDTNRPTKLAERFKILFDNQWTAAFDLLQTRFHREENTIVALLYILQNAMAFCKTMDREQMEKLWGVLVFGDKNVHGAEDNYMQKFFKDSRKALAPSAVENLFQAYQIHIRRSADVRLQMAMEVKSYVKECLEICWYMTVQDPPVVFAPMPGKNSEFDMYLFRPYKREGSHIAYVVWPALLLHENGPVLAEGVAQGYKVLSR